MNATKTLYCVVNDIDGNTFHTIDEGHLADVRERADDDLRRLIDAAAAEGVAEETVDRDGEEYTTRVIVQAE